METWKEELRSSEELDNRKERIIREHKKVYLPAVKFILAFSFFFSLVLCINLALKLSNHCDIALP